ncbi:Ribonuclease inhibitor [Neolecta irregularis DAH-3]|uniref:Ribonuclease inhibitor n=1 Tax=Neolecta irregularis (strain DAH-3) TaxID=1198029 RepID=A0A1U7LP93_NEOID|nr:Ribonuclease inhibitor [Neolecta irregularis DAH-3]|eukprot:OLL24486.1 Ribonuclease inhibitor [Neolecta irregularis DAH-3]
MSSSVSSTLKIAPKDPGGQKLARPGGFAKYYIKYDLISRATARNNNVAPQIELNLGGLNLGDQNFGLVCDGLLKLLDADAIELEELRLEENALTTAGLAFLSQVIRKSNHHLKDLSLASNNIKVKSPREIQQWSDFLSSFRNSTCLHRLDLSSNPLGDTAIEVLCRIYANEPPLMLFNNTPQHSFDSSDAVVFEQVVVDEEEVADEREQYANSPESIIPIEPGFFQSSSQVSQNTSISLSRMQGIRSIPYIILSSTNLTDISALFFIHIIPIHPISTKLLTYLPPQKHPFEQPTNTPCNGIHYLPNPSISEFARKVLAAHETIRDPRLRRRTSSITSLQSTIDNHIYCSETCNDLKPDRAKVKLESMILDKSGISATQLWKASISTLCLSRIFLSLSTSHRHKQAWEIIVSKTVKNFHVLDPIQREKIFEWAGDRETLKVEKSWCGKKCHVQEWKFLNSTGTLGYDMTRLPSRSSSDADI